MGSAVVVAFVILVLVILLAGSLTALVVQHRAARLQVVLLRAGELSREAGLAVEKAQAEVERSRKLVADAGLLAAETSAARQRAEEAEAALAEMRRVPEQPASSSGRRKRGVPAPTEG